MAKKDYSIAELEKYLTEQPDAARIALDDAEVAKADEKALHKAAVLKRTAEIKARRNIK